MEQSVDPGRGGSGEGQLEATWTVKNEVISGKICINREGYGGILSSFDKWKLLLPVVL